MSQQKTSSEPSRTNPVTLLARLQRMTREELRALQLRKLRRQLERVYATNGFYRRKYDAAKVRPEDIKSLDDFRKRIPVTTKADFLKDQEEHPPFGLRVGVPREQVALVNLTGGTSGQGQEIYGRTHADLIVQSHLHFLPWTIAGLRTGDFAINCAPTGGLMCGGWGPPDGFRFGGATAMHVGGVLSTGAKVDLMCRFPEIHFIYATANYVHTLSEAFRERQLDPREKFPTLKTIFTTAEPYSLEWARRIGAFWDCTLHEGYGSTQGTGFSFVTCEGGVIGQDGQRGMMHGMEWHNLSEIVNPETGEPVEAGEEGEIILTNLDMAGSPVIRFGTRDKARYLPYGACGCGCAWDGIEAGTVGRYDDMMKIRGNNIWPAAVDDVVFAHPELAEYAGRVFFDEKGRAEVLLQIAFKPDFSGDTEQSKAGLIARLGRALKDKTNVTMKIVEVQRSELPTFSYKARRWRDERLESARIANP